MSDFDFLNKAVTLYNESKNDNPTPDQEHKCILSVIHSGISICTLCGKQSDYKYTNEKEWVNYSASKGSNTDRTNIRRKVVKSIYKDLEGLNICSKIKDSANCIYLSVTDGRVYRGKSRKSIIFGCIFYAYKINGIPQNPSELLRIFSINKKLGLKGIKHISNEGPKPLIYTTFSPEKILIRSIMTIYTGTEHHIQEVYDIYDFIKDKSSNLNRARPKSLASAIVWYWIVETKKNIEIDHYIKSVGLSKITIRKLYNEIVCIYGK